ncbi:hypothetical protein HPB49_011480 [Dermacentor silvarum]|uniref:Uncharacterized protein n=1 Tax=Dermacentor silvarum TaxID=543639 RepID=A0ACB8DJ34_DERSI|nr:hypothetical protein HPB49_011480 [Dermacentor silvarum]
MSDDASFDFCLSWHELFTKDSIVITCSECFFVYHAGTGSGVGVAAVKAKPDIGKTWLCPSCKTSRLRCRQNSRKPKAEYDIDIAAKLSVMNQRLGALLPLLSKVDELMSVKETVVSIEKSVQELSSRYDTLLTVVTSQGKAISELAAREEKVESGSSAEEVRELNDLDQYSRRQNLEIHGIKPTEGENLLRELNNIARRLNVAEVTERHLDTVHRLPSKPDKAPVIIARFALGATKENWLEQRPQLKTLHLTLHNKRLLWLAKTKATEQSYKFVWQKNGRILVRKREGEQAIQIKTEADLAKIA